MTMGNLVNMSIYFYMCRYMYNMCTDMYICINIVVSCMSICAYICVCMYSMTMYSVVWVSLVSNCAI